MDNAVDRNRVYWQALHYLFERGAQTTKQLLGSSPSPFQLAMLEYMAEVGLLARFPERTRTRWMLTAAGREYFANRNCDDDEAEGRDV